MGIIDALILGILQGLTEFLPISSSGHLVLAEHFLGVENKAVEEAVLFILVLHLGTVFAVLYCYWNDIIGFFNSPGKNDEELSTSPIPRRILLMFVISIVATAIIALPIDKLFEAAFQNPLYAASGLLVTAAILALSLLGKGEGEIQSVNPVKAILIGIGQGIAVFPGISRSGTTIVIGMLLGLKGKEAARYTFLLSVPTIILASAVKFLDYLEVGSATIPIANYIVGFIASVIFGILAIKVLLKIIANGKMAVFAIYCLIAGVVALFTI